MFLSSLWFKGKGLASWWPGFDGLWPFTVQSALCRTCWLQTVTYFCLSTAAPRGLWVPWFCSRGARLQPTTDPEFWVWQGRGRVDSREFQKAKLELAVSAPGYIAFTLYTALEIILMPSVYESSCRVVQLSCTDCTILHAHLGISVSVGFWNQARVDTKRAFFTQPPGYQSLLWWRFFSCFTDHHCLLLLTLIFGAAWLTSS